MFSHLTWSFHLNANQLNLLRRFFASEPTSPISITSQHTLTDSSADNDSPHRNLSQSFALSAQSPSGQSSESDQYASFPCGQPTQAQSPALSTPLHLSTPLLIQQKTSQHLLPKQKLDQLCNTNTSKESASSISLPPKHLYGKCF